MSTRCVGSQDCLQRGSLQCRKRHRDSEQGNKGKKCICRTRAQCEQEHNRSDCGVASLSGAGALRDCAGLGANTRANPRRRAHPCQTRAREEGARAKTASLACGEDAPCRRRRRRKKSPRDRRRQLGRARWLRAERRGRRRRAKRARRNVRVRGVRIVGRESSARPHRCHQRHPWH